MSDSLLAWNRFVNPWPTAPAWIMTTYWLAILLISMSALFFTEPEPRAVMPHTCSLASAAYSLSQQLTVRVQRQALPPAAIETSQNPSEKKQE
jgi:hypothetical protein